MNGASAIELVGFAALCFTVAVAGGVAGLVLGNLRLPASVSIADTVSAGGGANVAISGVAASTAAYRHVRAGRINWRLFAWLAPTSLAGGFIGGALANSVPEGFLLGAIAVILYGTAIELMRWRPADPASVPVQEPGASSGWTGAGAADRVTATAIGLVVGVLGGMVGLILGALRLPALLRFTGELPQKLVGTNLMAGVLVGIAGSIGHLTSGRSGFDTEVFIVGATASVPGAWLGSHLTGRLSTLALVRTIGAIVAVAATGMAIRAIS